MNPDRIKKFALRGSEMRQRIYGRRVTLRHRDGTIVKENVHSTVGPVTHREKLEQGGFLPEVDTIIRIPVNMLSADQTDFENYEFIDERYPDKIFVTADAKDDPIGVEWVIGVREDV